MVEIYSMSFTHSSLIINIILIAAFILNLIFAFVIILWNAVVLVQYGLGYLF